MRESQIVPIIMVRDEEQAHESPIQRDLESERELPAPPPVYGNWRGSVVGNTLSHHFT